VVSDGTAAAPENIRQSLPLGHPISKWSVLEKPSILNAPISQWDILESFDSASDCEQLYESLLEKNKSAKRT
jgi:hypothetical protein